MRRLLVPLLIVACAVSTVAVASGQSPRPTPVRRSVSAVRVDTPPRIDGRLDDPAWQTAQRLGEFVQVRPVEGAPATEATDIWIAYDSHTIYIAVHAHYSDPSLVRANRVDRDQTGNDDTVTVSFDPFMDTQRAFALAVNGYGVQWDALQTSTPGGTTTDASWNALFTSAGELVEDGWTAELAVPIKSLRYPARRAGEAHRWAFQVQREIRSKNESVNWSPVSNDIIGQIPQMGVLEGMRDLSMQRNLEVMPSFTALQVDTRTAGGTLAPSTIRDAGLNVKFGVTSGLTLDVTVNPDFSQIDLDRPQIDVNQRFPLFFPELRPFFLEGQDVFRTNGPFPSLHTRTIIDPEYGVKLTGLVGKATLGVLLANDRAPGKLEDLSDPNAGRAATVSVARLRFDTFRESYSGMLVMSREFGQSYNRLGMIDNSLRFGRNYGLGATLAYSDARSAEGRRSTGHLIDVGLIKQGRNFTYISAVHMFSPEFKNESGFVPRTNQRRAFGNIAYRWWPEHWMVNWGPRFNYERLYDYSGLLQDEIRSLTLNALFARNITASSTVSRNMERFQGTPFEKNRVSASTRIDAARAVAVTADLSVGDEIRFVDAPFLGRSTVLGATATFRPMSRLQSELRWNTSRFVDTRVNQELFNVRIVFARTTYQLTPRLLVRSTLEHNSSNRTMTNNLLLTYRVNAGTVFFVGYDDRFRQDDRLDPQAFPTSSYQRTNRALFAKIQYLYRR